MLSFDALMSALSELQAPVLGKRAALDRLLAHVRLAIGRGVTVDSVSDCLLEQGIRVSPNHLRNFLANGKAPGRPPETTALIRAAGPVSALLAPSKKRGRSKSRSPQTVE